MNKIISDSDKNEEDNKQYYNTGWALIMGSKCISSLNSFNSRYN